MADAAGPRTRATLDKDPAEVAEMFDGVAKRYDITNTVLSFGQDRRWRAATRKALALTDSDVVLDLARSPCSRRVPGDRCPRGPRTP